MLKPSDIIAVATYPQRHITAAIKLAAAFIERGSSISEPEARSIIKMDKLAWTNAAVEIERIRSKVDASGKGMLPAHPQLAEILNVMADQYVSCPRAQAREDHVEVRMMERCLSAMSTVRGPASGNLMSEMMQEVVPSAHSYKIRKIDNANDLMS